MRWLMLDEFVEIRKGHSALAKSHFPDTEISSEVLLIEMIAQTGGALFGAENDYKDDVVFAKIDASLFPLAGIPGEGLTINVKAENLRSEGGWIAGEVSSPRGILATARVMLANAGRLIPGKTSSTTFHDGFMTHFKIREKIK